MDKRPAATLDAKHVSTNPLEQIRGTRIAHLIESDGPGGAERMLASLATELQAAGCRNLVIVPANGEGWLASELAGTGVAVEYLKLDRPVSLSCARWLEAAFRRYGITIAQSHEFAMAVYGAWACWRVGIGHVITMHGSHYYRGRLRRRLALRLAVALSEQVVAVSKQLANQMSRDLWVRPARIITIPNGVRFRPAERSTLREELRLAVGDPLLVAIGNLYPVKGHRNLLDALGLLADRHPRAHVAIAGRGDAADALLARARELGLADRVSLLGLRADVPGLLMAADIFVLPSRSEGLPLALLEAMFAGCAIVATDVGEVRSVLADGEAGVVVPPENPVALAGALDRLLSNPTEARRLAAHARRRAQAEYDVSRMAARYAALYRVVLDRCSPANARSLDHSTTRG